MDVLVFLCARAGDVVGADEIIESVWGGRPMGDNPVYKSIAKLRRALGDSTSNPIYIATVAKKGYRLVADVSALAPSDLRASAAPAETNALRRYGPILAGMLLGVALAAALFWRPQPEPLALQSVSSFRGSHSQPSFSPGADAIAFVNELDGNANIWRLDLDNREPRQLTHGSHGDSRPRWSPDGQSIIFQRLGAIWTVPANGGDATELIRDAYHPGWSHDGNRIVFERHFEVWIASADGGQQTRLAGIPRKELPLAPRWPAFSPDGSEIVYLDAQSTPFSDLWLIPVVGGEPKRLTFEPRISSAPAWHPDGQSVIYSTQRGGSQTLWQVNIQDGSARPLLTGSGDDNFPEISSDGKRLIYSNRRERFAIVRTNPVTQHEQVLHESRQLLLGPELAPDRNTVAFFGLTSDGGVQIFRMPLVAGGPTQLTFDPLATHAIPRWSVDGQDIYFYYTREGIAFSKVPSNGGDIEEIVAGWDWGVINGASVAPDGTRIVYSRLTGHVPVQTLIRDLATGNDTTFYAALEYPRWSRDGSSIIGALHVDQRFPGDIAICPLGNPPCRRIADNARIPMWSADESQLYFVRGYGASQDLYVASLGADISETRLMTMAPLFPLGPFYDVAANGDIVWVRYEQEASEIWLAELGGT